MSKKQKYPLMQKATAVWLVDNTSLTFKQIADFCGLHELEVKGIAGKKYEKVSKRKIRGAYDFVLAVLASQKRCQKLELNT